MANLILDPNSFNTGNWSTGAFVTVTGGTANGPDGTVNTASTLADTNAGSVGFRGQNVTVPNDTNSYVASLWIKKTTATVTGFPSIELDIAADAYSMVINTDTGVATFSSGGAYKNPDSSGVYSGSGWWLVWMAITNTHQTTWQFSVGPSFNFNGSGTASVTPTGSCIIWTAVLEAGTIPSAYPPTASFTWTPHSGPRTLAVAFTDTSSRSPTAWLWTFGDGATSTSQNPSHSYTSAGTYTVSLAASTYAGSDTHTEVSAVTVTTVLPTADFTYTPATGSNPLAVAFTNTSSNGTTYAWTFGDGSTSTSTSPSHTYSSAGGYTVALTATNVDGSDTKTVTNAVAVVVAHALMDVVALGAAYATSSGVTNAMFSCATSRKLVRVARTTGTWAIAGSSAAMDSEPGKVIYFNSKFWLVTADGYVRRFTTAATPVQDLAVNTYAATNRWIVAGGLSPYYVVAPTRTGGVITLNTSGVETDRMEGVLSRVTCAVGLTGSDFLYVYCFDGLGHGAIVQVDADGAMSAGGFFSATNCQGVLDGFESDGLLVLGVKQRGMSVVFDASEPTAPVYDASNTIVYGGGFNGVVTNDGIRKPLTDDPVVTSDDIAGFGLTRWFPATAGYAVGTSIYAIAHGRNGRIQVT